MKEIKSEVEAHINDQRQGEMLRHGVRTVIVGAPNIGKSSFINLLCQRNISIVTPIAGTTRDVIQVTYNIGGYPVLISDTAGLRATTLDSIEQEGMSRAKDCIQNADFILLMVDASTLVQENVNSKEKLKAFMHKYLSELDISFKALQGKPIQMIANKIDLVSLEAIQKLQKIPNLTSISCKEETNLKSCLEKMSGYLKEM